MRFDFEELS